MEILFINLIIEFVIENSQKSICWDVEEGICTIYVWYIIMLKCDYENTLNFETSMKPSMAMDGFVEEKYDPMSFDTQIVDELKGN